jgi:acyl carrier protein
MNENREKLRSLLTDVLLLGDGEFRFDLKRTDVDAWDSLAVVSIAVGVEETFQYHMSAEEAAAVQGVADLMKILEGQAIRF